MPLMLSLPWELHGSVWVWVWVCVVWWWEGGNVAIINGDEKLANVPDISIEFPL